MTLFREYGSLEKHLYETRGGINRRIGDKSEDELLGVADPLAFASEMVTKAMPSVPALNPDSLFLERSPGQIEYKVRFDGDPALTQYGPKRRGTSAVPDGDVSWERGGQAQGGYVHFHFAVTATTTKGEIEQAYHAWLAATEEWLSCVREDVAEFQRAETERVAGETSARQEAIRHERALFEQLEGQPTDQGKGQ